MNILAAEQQGIKLVKYFSSRRKTG